MGEERGFGRRGDFKSTSKEHDVANKLVSRIQRMDSTLRTSEKVAGSLRAHFLIRFHNVILIRVRNIGTYMCKDLIFEKLCYPLSLFSC